MRLGHRQPGLRGAREAGLRGICLPGYRRTRAVSSGKDRQESEAVRVANLIRRQSGAWQAELLALIKANAARQAAEQRQGQPLETLRLLPARIPARGNALDIVIAERPAEPTGAIERRRFLDRLTDDLAAKRRFHHAERISHMEARAAGHLGDPVERADLARHFADRHRPRIPVDERTNSGSSVAGCPVGTCHERAAAA